MIDFIIVLFYFTIIFVIALRGKVRSNSSAEEYFLSSRNLSWYSIALSTIATNIQGYQFLAVMVQLTCLVWPKQILKLTLFKVFCLVLSYLYLYFSMKKLQRLLNSLQKN